MKKIHRLCFFNRSGTHLHGGAGDGGAWRSGRERNDARIMTFMDLPCNGWFLQYKIRSSNGRRRRRGNDAPFMSHDWRKEDAEMCESIQDCGRLAGRISISLHAKERKDLDCGMLRTERERETVLYNRR